MQVINQAETEVKLYRTDELIPGRTYIVKVDNHHGLNGRVVITLKHSYTTNSLTVVGVDNKGYLWLKEDSENHGYLLQEVNAEIHVKKLL